MREHIGPDSVRAVDQQAMYPGRPAAILDALESRTLKGEEQAEDRPPAAPVGEHTSPATDGNASEPPD